MKQPLSEKDGRMDIQSVCRAVHTCHPGPDCNFLICHVTDTNANFSNPCANCFAKHCNMNIPSFTR